ncbi:MAG: glycosyltransferase family 2 protein [Lachnospiraceae bacterium]|nr:glycosyltransferase family 2 protein [Lachnospiraceae bacterium]
MAKVSVIIPNYNGIEYIDECLLSLRNQSYKDFDIIVVDNKSTDSSADKIESDYPEVKLVRLEDNYGFSRAANEGLIRTKNSEFVILLNADTKAEPDFVKELVNAIEGNEKIFSVASKMIQLDRNDRYDGAGDLYCCLGWAYAIGKDMKIGKYEKECNVFSACAGACIYRRAIFEQIGYFDEYHFMYLEDVDIGYRARIMGYINRYTPKAVVYHAGSGITGSRYNPFKVRIAARNSWYVIYKNMPLLQIIINLPFFIIGFSIKALFFIIKGYGREYLSGMKRGFLLCTEGKKYPYSGRFFFNYVKIQFELWINLVRRAIG